MRSDMNTAFRLLAAFALIAPLAACSDGSSEVEAKRQAAREAASESRARQADIERVRATALDTRYPDAVRASAEEVAEAIKAIPLQARRIRAAEAVRGLELRIAPVPLIVGPRARGDLAVDNTAPIETIQNAIEGSALTYSAVRERGVVIADIVAATFEDGRLIVYLAGR